MTISSSMCLITRGRERWNQPPLHPVNLGEAEYAVAIYQFHAAARATRQLRSAFLQPTRGPARSDPRRAAASLCKESRLRHAKDCHHCGQVSRRAERLYVSHSSILPRHGVHTDRDCRYHSVSHCIPQKSGYLRDIRRLTVALSRARLGLLHPRSTRDIRELLRAPRGVRVTSPTTRQVKSRCGRALALETSIGRRDRQGTTRRHNNGGRRTSRPVCSLR